MMHLLRGMTLVFGAALLAGGCGAKGGDTSSAGHAPGTHLITVTSDRDVDDVVARIDAECKKHEFGVLGIRDLKATLAKKNLDLKRETKLMDVCSPPRAHKVLTEHPPIVTVLPCRIAVYKGDDGKTVVQSVKPGRLFEMFDSPGCSETASEVDVHLRQIMEAAAAK